MFTKTSPRSENLVKFPFPAAVYKLSEIRIDNEAKKVYVRVRAYADADAASLCDQSSTSSGPMPGQNTGYILERNHTLEMSSLSAVTPAAIEADVMALPEYAGATVSA